MKSSQPPFPSSQPDPASDSDSGDEHGPRLTVTQEEQLKVGSQVAEIYRCLAGAPPHTQSVILELWRDKHIKYLTKGLNQLGHTFQVLDANRPWLCYWILHSIALLGEAVDSELESRVVDFLSRCQDKEGGYAGGPGQLPHLATTYAAVNTLVTLGTERALSSINRESMYKFLLRMKESSGGFRMHQIGEVDARSCYCAISVASLLNILDADLVRGVGDYIASCQTYEGGIGGEPHSEAHGGYAFCGLAAVILIDEVEKINLPSLIDWVAFRQGVELGFQGRANKLVDGCYSFWQGAALALVQKLSPIAKKVSDEQSSIHAIRNYSDIGIEFIRRCNQTGPLFHHMALQQYIILCSQVLEGGFRDKPGKYRDYYHTCYCLSGLSICQYSRMRESDSRPSAHDILGPYSNLVDPVHPLYNVVLDKFFNANEFFSSRMRESDSRPSTHDILGPYSNLVEPVHPLYNVVLDKFLNAHEFFSSRMRESDLRPSPHDVLGPYSNLVEPVHPLYNVVLDKFFNAHEFFSSGLPLCQYSRMRESDSRPSTHDVLGPYSNLVEPVHPLYNVVLDKFFNAHEFFSRSF